jgi:uncharacterized protein
VAISRKDLILATLSVLPDAKFAPVQVQKIFFLIDKNVSSEIGGSLFSFEPYDYGPFDKSIYRDLEQLKIDGVVEIEIEQNRPSTRKYSLTSIGLKRGKEVYSGLPSKVQSYVSQIVPWASSLTFSELVGAVYKAYPEMKINSIFKH